MGLLAQLFRHKNSPPREDATVPEPDADAQRAEVRGVGAVAEKIRAADAMTAPVKTVHIPAAAVQSMPATTAPAPAPATAERMTELQTAPAFTESAPAEKITEAPAPREHAPAMLTTSAQTPSAPIAEPLAAAPIPVPALESFPPEIPLPAIPSPAVTLPPPAQHETPPPITVAATEQRELQRELRPEKEVAISTTLRAAVLGGVAPSGSSDAPNSAGQILAPRVTVKATATPVPLVLGPSVIPSANAGGILLAPRTTPDFAALQKLFMTDAALDLAGIASLAATLPGVRACVISGAAGNAMVGDFSHGVSAEEVRLASANLVQRAGPSMETLHRDGSDVAIFLHGDTCVAVILTSGGFVPGVHERLARAAELLAGAQPAP
ncbi:MAG: hypothetical protein NTV08_18155 [Verrucomicrobia bacterium]|nr:hypothetical protein [Verrucomicrobiota bacterium]